MSVKVMGAVWDADLPQNEKLILLAYADYAAHDGTGIYPSVSRMAWKTGYSERTVQRVTKKLIERGILVKCGQHQRFGTNSYQLNIRALPERPEYNESSGGDKMTGGDKLSPGGRQNDTPGGDKVTPEPSCKPSCKPSDKRRRGASASQPHQPGFADQILSDDQVTDMDFDRWEDRVLRDTIKEVVKAKTKNPRVRGPRKFQSLEQKRAWRDAVATIKAANNGAAERALQEFIRRGKVKGRTNLAGLVTWIAGCARNGGRVFTGKNGGSNGKHQSRRREGRGRGEVYVPSDDERAAAEADAARQLREMGVEVPR